MIMASCWDNNQKQTTTSGENIPRTIIDTVKIVHAILSVKIPVKGYLDYWKKKTLLAADTSQIISVLVEDGQKVAKNDYLLSLWQLYKSKEFTPVDIRAPFPGVIEKVYVKIRSRIGKNKPLLRIYNHDFFSMKIKMHQDQIKILRKNQIVVSTVQEFKLDGFVESVDRRSNTVNLRLKNNDQMLPKENMVKFDINCGNVKGDFILSKDFKNDKIIAYIDNESSFEISAIGISDSLSLISPKLPHLSKLSVVSHNY